MGRTISIQTGPGHRSRRTLGIAAKALVLARRNKKSIQSEREIKNLNLGLDTTPDTTGVVSNVSLLPQGLDDDERIGNKVKAFSIKLGGSISQHPTATNTFCRYMIVRDRFGTTAQPAITDMFSSVAAFANGHPTLGLSQVSSRFQVLIDVRIAFSDVHRTVVYVNKYKKLNFPIYWENTGATDEGKNNLYSFSASTEASNVPAASLIAQFKFIG